MEKLNRPDVNTKEYWDKLYKNGERRGWWHNSTAPGSIRTFFKKDILEKIHNGENNFIEVGGGNGAGADIIKEEFKNINVWNLDISATAIETGKKKFPTVNQVCFDLQKNIDILNLNNTFNILLCQETIEHIENLAFSLDQIMKLLKIGGVACFTFPNSEKYTGGFEHIWSFNHDSIPKLFYKYTDEVTVCNFKPFEKNSHIHLLTKFKKQR